MVKDAWNQGQVRQGLVCNGYWAVDFAHDGEYHFELLMLAQRGRSPATEGIPSDKIDLYNEGKALELQSATIKIGEDQQTQPYQHPIKACLSLFNYLLARPDCKLT